MGCGSFLFALPHFISGRYLPADFDVPQTVQEISAELCNANAYFPDPDEDNCEEESIQGLINDISSYR